VPPKKKGPGKWLDLVHLHLFPRCNSVSSFFPTLEEYCGLGETEGRKEASGQVIIFLKKLCEKGTVVEIDLELSATWCFTSQATFHVPCIFFSLKMGEAQLHEYCSLDAPDSVHKIHQKKVGHTVSD
jgi:hypothetical protein